MSELKFDSDDDRKIFAIEEKLAPASEIFEMSSDRLHEITESLTGKKLLDRHYRKTSMIDHTKSRDMKKKWGNKRRNFMKGINRFHKSIKGKRLHQKVAQARREGKYGNIHEAYTLLNSVLTRLAINASYNSSLIEESFKHVLFEEGVRILSPVLQDLVEGKVEDLNEYLNGCEAGQFLDDLFCISESVEPAPGELSAEEMLSEDPLAVKILRDPDDASQLSDDDAGDPTGEASKARESGEATGDTVVESFNSGAPIVDIVESYYEGSDVDDDQQFQMITESAEDPDVDGEHVIAKIVGPAFFPDTASRNKVEYSRQLWDGALRDPETLREIKARRMYGTFGHKTKIDDDALLDGKISHIVGQPYIDDRGVGMCSYLVLNTEPGRNLKTYMGAKSRLRVSTRCRGAFLPGFNTRGNKVPDPKTFRLKGIDFVHDPGYLDAEPSLS